MQTAVVSVERDAYVPGDVVRVMVHLEPHPEAATAGSKAAPGLGASWVGLQVCLHCTRLHPFLFLHFL